ncbi:MAG: YafY family transcriptional regulator [Flavipsychrobacter sp.]|nr:YafY family transcriptional regulator [Flavipsychrobacter sp.]
MNRIDRLFGITTMLQSKKYVPAEKIAEKFGISVRTVYRDVKALSEQGIPVSFEQNRGYFLVQGYFLPPVSFTPEEANALLLMEKVIFGFADRSIHAHYATMLNKVKAVLHTREKDRLEQLNNSIKMRVSDHFSGNLDYLATLQSAISDKHIIEVEYSNTDGVASKRKLEPIGLVFYAAAWHIIAWCHLRHEYRDFKVMRIVKLTKTGIPFKREKHITLNDYIASLQLACVPVM